MPAVRDREEGPDWSSVSVGCWEATVGVAGPIWSAEGEAVCLLGISFQRALLLIT